MSRIPRESQEAIFSPGPQRTVCLGTDLTTFDGDRGGRGGCLNAVNSAATERLSRQSRSRRHRTPYHSARRGFWSDLPWRRHRLQEKLVSEGRIMACRHGLIQGLS
jgi:hypothetical protein